jgi:hypothetical protein
MNALRPLKWLVVLVGFLISSPLPAEMTSGQGGLYTELHLANLSAFDPSVSGLPIVLGGEGFGSVTRNFRIGGGGGGGFIYGPNDSTHFGMGYGGVMGEYLFSNWLSFSLLIGGGGYAISNVVSSSQTQALTTQVAAGGFLLVKPALKAEFPISNAVRISGSIGLFLPNVSQLQSVTVGLHLAFGRGYGF